MATLPVETVQGGVRFEVRVAPKASRTAVLGVHEGALKVALSAPPIDGAANAALVRLLAKRFEVPKRAVRLLRGERNRRKQVQVEGVDSAAVHALAGE